MLLIDLTHTSHTRARTGIQRVCRSLLGSLRSQQPVSPVCHDPFWDAWRPLESWEEANLYSADAARSRGARWPWPARFRGRLARWRRVEPPALPASAGLIVPEIFSPAAARAFPRLFPLVTGPKVALFHDAIVLKLPEMSPAKTVGRFPAYLRELTLFDGIAAISESSRDSLIDYWRWAGIREVPPVETITLGIDSAPAAPLPGKSDSQPEIPTVLSVGTVEGRKNHLTLLNACERLWSRGVVFRLHLIGTVHPETGRQAVQRIRELQHAGRPIQYDGPVAEPQLLEAYRNCQFTAYPSLLEGFGLPVLESLVHGKPCICSPAGALAEAARDGGCVMLPTMDAPSLADAINRLLEDPAELARLKAEAGARTFKTWGDHARQLVEWMGTLTPRG